MARLGKHGKELLRITKEIDTPDGDLTIWECRTRAYMSDGKVLEKWDVRFKPNPNATWENPRGEFHGYGWKITAKKKPTVSMADYLAMVERIRGKAQLPESKWQLVGGAPPPPVVISQERVLRAIESGDSIGFCRSCGAEQDGCVPDARNYRCESCGQSDVYGAEECLIA